MLARRIATRASFPLRVPLSRPLSSHHHHPRDASHHDKTPDHPVLFSKDGPLATVTLNRPSALNALNLEMVRSLDTQFRGPWSGREKSIAAVWLQGAGGRAFCAGGDIKTLWEGRGSPSGHAAQEAFFSEEYAVDHLLANDSALHRPHIAIYDGAVMGGGVGVSIHATFRVATERTTFAMPETAIGFFPDVGEKGGEGRTSFMGGGNLVRPCPLPGGSYFLPRLPLGPEFGLFLALTGHRLVGADAVHAGVATHFVPQEKLAALRADAAQELRAHAHWSRDDAVAAVSIVLNRHAVPLPDFTITRSQQLALRHAFGGASAAEVLEAVHAAAKAAASTEDAAFLAKAAKALGRASPTSLRVTFEQLRRGAALPSLVECLKMELRMAMHTMTASGDFYEGVRALLVDKDGKPQWSPAALADVSDTSVNAYFAPRAHEPHL